MTLTALQAAIEIVGSQAELARQIGASARQVSNWVNREKRAAARYCTEIERVTLGKVTCYDLRPDIFPPPQREPDECDSIATLPP